MKKVINEKVQNVRFYTVNKNGVKTLLKPSDISYLYFDWKKILGTAEPEIGHDYTLTKTLLKVLKKDGEKGHSPIAKHGDYVYYRRENTPKSTAIVRYNEKEKTFDVVDIPSLLGVDKSRINCIHDDVNDTTYLFIGIDVNTFEIINLGTDELTYFSSEYLDGIKCDKGGYYVMGENVVMLCMFDGRTLKLKSTKALVDYVLKRNKESNHPFVNTGKVQWLHGMRKDASLMEKVEGNKFARLRRKTKDIDGETIEWDFYDDRCSIRGTDTLTIHLRKDA